MEPEPEETKVQIQKPKLGLYIAMIVIGFILFLILATGGAVQISATNIGVVENTVTGQFETLKAGRSYLAFRQKSHPFCHADL